MLTRQERRELIERPFIITTIPTVKRWGGVQVTGLNEFYSKMFGHGTKQGAYAEKDGVISSDEDLLWGERE